MSLTGGLIPVSGERPASTGRGGATKKSSGFDDFDDLLDAPVKKTTSKGSKGKKTKKKNSSRKSFDSDQSYDNFDDPDSPGGALSPHFGNSYERDDFLKMDLPRGVGEGDLDDSILGGLMGGPPKASKPLVRPNSATEKTNITKPSSIPNYSESKKEPAIAPSPIINHSEMESIQRPPTNVGRRRAGRDWSDNLGGGDDILETLSAPLNTKPQAADDDLFGAPSIRTSRPGTGTGRRTGARGFSPEDQQIEAPTQAPVLSAPSQTVVPAALTVKPKKTFDDWDDDDADFDIDSLLPDADSNKAKPTTTLQKSTPSFQPSKPEVRQDEVIRGSNTNKPNFDLDDSIDTPPAPAPTVRNTRPLSAPGSEANQGKGTTESLIPQINQNQDMDPPKNPRKDDDDIDLGFMPSFLEPGREARSRRQIGRAKTSQERTLPENRFVSKSVDEFDALDSALGIGGKSTTRTVKAVDPFGHAETVLQEKKAQRPLTENTNRTDSFRLSHITHTSEEKEAVQNIPTDISLQQNANVPKVTSVKTNNLKKDEPQAIVNNIGLMEQEEKIKTTVPEQGLRLVSLPSLTPPKPDPPLQETKSVTATSTPTNKKNPIAHNLAVSLSVQVEDSLDEPLSYPPTANPSQLLHELDMTAPKSPTKMPAGSVTFGPNITTSPTSNVTPTTPASAKKILKKSGSGSNEASAPQQQTTTPKRHSMPTWLSPNSSIDLGNSTSPLNRSKESVALRHVQEKLEEVTLQKDATEKFLRLEIETLRNRLDGTQSGATEPIISHQLTHSMSNPPHLSVPHSQPPHSQPTLNLSNIHEIEELKLKIQYLMEENRVLKEEAMIERIKHQRELTHLNEKHQADLDLGNISKVEELTLLEKRHRDAIEALKRIHLDELNAIKQRAKDGAALEHLSSQISTTTGSLKLIEEQMNLKYRGIDAVREGQYEARERLLTEMEAKAIERAELAEAEGFKLKGLLTHMEQVVHNLRNQGGEERERLRMEHRRLEAMQLNIQAERKVLQDRTVEELTEMKKKMAMIQEREMIEMKKHAEEKAEFNEMKRQFELDKKEFACHVNSNIKSTELTTAKLKTEEERLQKMKSDILRERDQLEQDKEQADYDLKQADIWRQSIRDAQDDIRREKFELEIVAAELQDMSNKLVEKDLEIEKRQAILSNIEKSLEEERSQLQNRLKDIHFREQEVSMIYEHTNGQRLAIRDMEDEILQKRRSLANQRKELSKIQFAEIYPTAATRSNGEKENLRNRPPDFSSSGYSGKYEEYSPEKLSFQSPPPVVSSSITQGINVQQWEEELQSAKRVMEMARGGRARTTQASFQRDQFIKNETDFLSKIKKRDF